MSRRKPLAALAAVTASLALVVPTGSASAAPTAPAVRTASVAFGPGSLYCQVLYNEVRAASATGNVFWTSYFSNVFVYSHCGGAAI